jgi:hypothetical protein
MSGCDVQKCLWWENNMKLSLIRIMGGRGPYTFWTKRGPVAGRCVCTSSTKC